MCGGFTCSRNGLAALNVLYILVGLLLITVASYGKYAAVVNEIAVIGGIIACGVFLLLISIVGLIGAVKHHQVCLFFYMVILFLLFLIQFGVACGCLAFDTKQQQNLLTTGWDKVTNETRIQCQTTFNCCALRKDDQNDEMKHPVCLASDCCNKQKEKFRCCTGKKEDNEKCPCQPCLEAAKKTVNTALRAAGGLGLFFSFTEIIGVCLAVRFRNQKDPRANPSAFL